MADVCKIDLEDFEHDAWEGNWYKCPACKFNSIALEFNFCPDCGVKLTYDEEELQEIS